LLRKDSLTLVAIVLALIPCTAGCSGDSDRSNRGVTSVAAATEATPAESSKAIRCLHEARLSDVKQRDGGQWGGLHQGPAYAIVVHKLLKPAKAPRVVAGEYAVAGSFKVVAVGRGLIGNDGLQADALVQIVADCLVS
jgi:hypothetical protein